MTVEVYAHLYSVISALPDVRHRCFLVDRRAPPTPTLFPYTTLFRSRRRYADDRFEIVHAHFGLERPALATPSGDRKSTRLNSSHVRISYAVFCLKKKKPPLTPSRWPCASPIPPPSLRLRQPYRQ